MKKIVFIGLAAFITLSAAAQKVSIKKGEIQVDGTPVAKMEKVKGTSSEYVFSDLNGTALFNADLVKQTPEGNQMPESILMLKAPNGTVKEFDTKNIKISLTLSTEKLMCDYVMNCGAGLITPQGVDLQKVDEYFQTSDRSITTAFDNELREVVRKTKEEDELANSVNLTVKRDGSIFANGKKIGSISVIKDENRVTCSYHIVECSGIPMASMDAKMTTKPNFYKTKTYDGNVFSVFSEKGFSFLLDSDDNAKRMVRKLYYEGYTLGDMKGFFEEKKRAEKEALIAASGNIYQKQGYVITGKSKQKVEGLITLEFMPKSDALGKTESSINELNKYGNSVFVEPIVDGDDGLGLLIIDDKKEWTVKNDVRRFNAIDGVRVVVDDVQYLGVAGNLIGSTGITGVRHSSFFYKIIYEKDNNMILQEHKFGTVMLKLANQNKPIVGYTIDLLGKTREGKINAEFDEYINCQALTYSDYKTTTIEGLIKLVDDYVEKCK